MKVVRTPSPAAVALLRQATALAPKRMKASDGLLPSAAHLKTNPTSDHNTGLAVDLTHDPKNGIDCAQIFEELKKDKRVKYLIFNKKIWSKDRAKEGNRVYTGSNPHTKHLHVSINDASGNDVSDWFAWMKKAEPVKVEVKKEEPKKVPVKPDVKEPEDKYNTRKSIIGGLLGLGKNKAECTCVSCPVHKKGK